MFASGTDFADDPGSTRAPARLPGDWYCEPDLVTRGCDLKLPPATKFEEPGPSAGGFADWDRCGGYRESDAFVGGKVSPGPSTFFDVFSGNIPDMGLSQSTHVGSFHAYYQKRTTEEISGVLPKEEFNESHIPPCKPSDSEHKLEITTMYVPSSRPYEIGNALLKFFSTQVKSRILKVTLRKFAILAEVFVGSIMCTMKARVYGEGQNTYAMEFQRRSGDTLAFNSAYQQATQFILPQFTEIEAASIPEAGPMFPPLPRHPLGASAEEDEILDLGDGSLPLLDMAGQVEVPALQAESASSLADIAQDDRRGATLCTIEAFREFEKLLQNDQTDVAYPTACMLQSLAKFPEAAQCFADDRILSLILEKMRSEKTCKLVQQKLAQVLNAAIPRCAASLTEEVSREVVEALRGLIREGENATTREEAQRALGDILQRLGA